MSQSPTMLIVGLSGPSASGKTSLARVLREVFNVGVTKQHDGLKTNLFILHEDDFYKTDTKIPTREVSSQEHGTRIVQDWDCVESLNLPLLKSTLQHIAQHGSLPPDMRSKVDETTADDTFVTEDEMRKWQDIVSKWSSAVKSDSTSTSASNEIRICILDGFLLYPPAPSTIDLAQPPALLSTTSPSQLAELYSILQPLLSLKLFLPSTYDLTVKRRAERKGYVTIEGFWSDPPGYVEDVVWPNYARDHGWLFDDLAAVNDGKVIESVAKDEGIIVGPGPGASGGKDIVISWGVKVLQTAIENTVGIE